MFRELKLKSECAAFSFSWVYCHQARELVDNKLANVQAKPDSFDVNILGWLQEPKQLEKFGLVLFLDSNPIVDHWNLDEAIRSFFEQLANNLDLTAFWSEFQGVALEI